MKISILMLTYNAPIYVLRSIWGLKTKTTTPNFTYELVVVDNKSKNPTRALLFMLQLFGMIDKLYFNSNNDLFAGGNNIAASLASKDSSLLLLLNSDIKIVDSDWLFNLYSRHESGVTAYGLVDNPRRADGYCYLVDASLYKKYPLDEEYQWWWSITKQQAMILQENVVRAYRDHETQLHHYGGKSGKGYKDARGMDIDLAQVKKWFKSGNRVKELKF